MVTFCVIVILARTENPAIGQDCKHVPKDRALEVIRKTLASVELPPDESIRTHRYIQKLKGLETELSANR